MTLRTMKFAAAVGLALAGPIYAFVPANAVTAVEVGGAPMYPTSNIIENAVNSRDHTTLVAAVKAAGLVNTLEQPGPFTVFAPVNEAFDKLPNGTVQTLLKYPGEIQVYFEGTFCNARNAAMIEFMGTDGTLYIDRGRYEIHPERDRRSYEEWVLGTGKRGQDFYDKPDGELLHLTNWAECVRSRKPPNAPVEAGVSAASAAHLGNQALRAGQVVKWQA